MTTAVTNPALAAALELTRGLLAKHPTLTAANALDVLAGTYMSLTALQDAPEPERAAEPAPLVPAVPIKDSVHDDYIVCLEDGREFKMMKRHLRSLGMTPEEYRAKWGLPHDYPMTAPGYSAQKRTEAKTVGLGTTENKLGFNRGRLAEMGLVAA
jgi:predicted transcriptional regulator